MDSYFLETLIARAEEAEWDEEEELFEAELDAEQADGPNMTKEDKNPNGGLSQKGRNKLKRAGQNVKKGVTSYSSGSDSEKRRWVRWALRFTATPRPLKKPNGEPTRYALMFKAWGEPVPTSADAVAAVHAKALKRRDQLGMG